MDKPSRAQLRAWMRQWKYAAETLPGLEYEELRQLSRQQLLKRIDAVLSLAGDPRYRDPSRWSTSGLVEQQLLFGRLKSR
ncbi:MAG: hypothetical protein ACE5JX_08425 [Acidobacteriota bacterium]